MESMAPSSTSTIFFFVSPQFLSTHTNFTKRLVKLSRERGVLRSIVMDEAHLHAQHGSSFRPDLRCLTTTFFRPIFGKRNKRIPFFVAGTATMSRNDLEYFSGLTTVTFDESTRFWASANEFCIPTSNILFDVSSAYTSRLDRTVAHLEEQRSSAFVYTNTAALARGVAESLESKLDLSNVFLEADVVTITGALEKGKNSSMSLLCGVTKRAKPQRIFREPDGCGCGLYCRRSRHLFATL